MRLFGHVLRLVAVVAVVSVFFQGFAQADVLDLSAAPIYTSSNYTGSQYYYPPEYAFDGISSTQWMSDYDYEEPIHEWIMVDLGTDHTLNSVEIDRKGNHEAYTLGVLTSAQGLSTDPSVYTQVASVVGRVDTSNNWVGGNWNDLFDFSDGSVTFYTGSAASSSASTPVTGRYLMLDITEIPHASKMSVALWEIRVDGSPVPEPSTVALLGMSLIGLLAYAWRKRK